MDDCERCRYGYESVLQEVKIYGDDAIKDKPACVGHRAPVRADSHLPRPRGFVWRRRGEKQILHSAYPMDSSVHGAPKRFVQDDTRVMTRE